MATDRIDTLMRDELGALAAFEAVARAASFTRAAGRLGTTQSALSHRLRRFEQRLGVRLLTRTTRSVALTDAGRRLLERIAPALDVIREQLAEAVEDDGSGDVAGIVRITSADHVVETLLWPALRPLLASNPRVRVEIEVDNGLVDVVAGGFDAGVRLGRNLHKDMVAVPVGPPERVAVVGSPGYLADHGHPQTPADLAHHACIDRRMPTLGGFPAWRFERGGKATTVRVAGQVAFNRPELILEAAASGFGLAYVLLSQASPFIADGRLVRVLDDWCPGAAGYHLYYPSRRQKTRALELVVDAVRYRP